MEPAGLEAVFLANRARLVRFLQAHGAGEHAEDLVQELWIRIAGAGTGPVAQPLSYLYRAANNLMLDRFRSARASTQRDQAWGDAATTVPGQADTPAQDRVLIAHEEVRLVASTLAELGSRAEAIFRLHRVEGIAQRDIAARMGVSLSTVEADLRRAYAALIALRQKLDDPGPRPMPVDSVMPGRDV